MKPWYVKSKSNYLRHTLYVCTIYDEYVVAVVASNEAKARHAFQMIWMPRNKKSAVWKKDSNGEIWHQIYSD